MENNIIKIKCPLCDGKVGLWGQKNGHDLYSCMICKLIFVFPTPNQNNIYGEDYFSGAKKGFGYVNYDVDKEPMVSTFNKYIDLLQKFGKKEGTVFDIGTATGFFLKIAKKRGYVVSGIEISDHAASLARKDGLDVKTGEIDSIIEKSKYDIVTMLDVLEHMNNPFISLLKTKQILKNGGLLVINTPNGESVLSKILKKNWHLVVPPEHLYFFSPNNLVLFLEKQGFKVLYSGSVGKQFTFQYVFKMLYKWQKIKFWNTLSKFFSKSLLSHIYIPINLHDNFLLILEKNEK